MLKSSSDTCVKYGLPAHSPIAHTFRAVVSRRSFTRMCPFSVTSMPRLFEANSLCVWRASKRNQKVGSFYLSRAVFALNLRLHALTRNTFDSTNIRPRQNVDSFISKELQNGLGNIGVFVGRQLRAAFDHRYAAPQPAQRLAQL